jgi:hypothetical protein
LNKLEPLTFNPKFGPCWFVDKNFQPVLRNLNPRDDYDL